MYKSTHFVSSYICNICWRVISSLFTISHHSPQQIKSRLILCYVLNNFLLNGKLTLFKTILILSSFFRIAWIFFIYFWWFYLFDVLLMILTFWCTFGDFLFFDDLYFLMYFWRFLLFDVLLMIFTFWTCTNLNCIFKLVRDVELVCVKEQDDPDTILYLI